MHSAAGAVLAASPLDPSHLLSNYGLIGLALIIFAECGILLGFFLPGDTLLFSAGLLIATGTITTPLWVFLVVAPIAAVAGNLVGYWIGRKAGPKVFDRPNSRLFRPEYVVRSAAFFDRYGSWTIILARFVPIMRTVATVMAGVGRMRFSLYLLYSIIGGVLWTTGLILTGLLAGAHQLRPQYGGASHRPDPHRHRRAVAPAGDDSLPARSPSRSADRRRQRPLGTGLHRAGPARPAGQPKRRTPRRVTGRRRHTTPGARRPGMRMATG
jgi:membrane-associated protein